MERAAKKRPPPRTLRVGGARTSSLIQGTWHGSISAKNSAGHIPSGIALLEVCGSRSDAWTACARISAGRRG